MLVMLVACGGKQSPRMAETVRPAIQLEWKVTQGEGDDVLVSLIVAGKREELGPIPAATETEAGSPRTCALRSAHPLRTELTCGDLTRFYVAELQGEELVFSFDDGSAKRELRRMSVFGDGLSVAPLQLSDQ
jgi:hypothetical protein